MPLITKLGHWFAQNYLLLLIFMPFINSGLLSLSHNKYKALVILIIVIYCIFKGIVNVYKIPSTIFNVSSVTKMVPKPLLSINDGFINSSYILFV